MCPQKAREAVYAAFNQAAGRIDSVYPAGLLGQLYGLELARTDKIDAEILDAMKAGDPTRAVSLVREWEAEWNRLLKSHGATAHLTTDRTVRNSE